MSLKLSIEGAILEDLRSDYTSPRSEKHKDNITRLLLTSLRHNVSRLKEGERVTIQVGSEAK